MSTKKQRTEFRRKAEDLIRKHGGRRISEDEQLGLYDWLIESKYGPLLLRVDDYERKVRYGRTEQVGAVFTRFDDVTRAPRFVDCNPHSGKWNHHYFGHWTVYRAILNLGFHLQAVAPLPHTYEATHTAG